MNNSEEQSSRLLDGLDQKTLLQLATGEHDSGNRKPAYALPDQQELQELFPDLRIIELVGTGGMGCVFRADQTRLERTVALKILPRELGDDDLFAERFAREARAMARLNHPNIVAIHDFGERSGLHFLIMEFMDGMNLRELLDAGPLEPVDALGIVEQICQALAFAHAEGVIHRDIKPENILFSRTGHVALADFGLARLATDSNAAVSLTQTRQAMGTLNYMAPEQWENSRNVDHRADVYSLGILLYELLTGRVPRGSFPPPSSLCSVSTSIDAVVNKALQANAADRYQSVTDFCEAVISGDEGASPSVRFDQNGTLTNFMNFGAGVVRSLPSPAKLMESDQSGKHAVWTNLIAGVCVMILTMLPWVTINESNVYLGVETYVVIAQVQIPVAFLPVASAVVFLLTLLRNKLHPVRADLLSLVICALSIVVVAVSFHRLDVFQISSIRADRQFTVGPFLTLLVLSLQAIETLVRMGLHFWWPLVRIMERNLENERRRKAEKKERRHASWKAFLDGCHDFIGRGRRGKRD